MELILNDPAVFVKSLSAFLTLKDICCAEVAISSEMKLRPLLKALFESDDMQQQIMKKMLHMTDTEVIDEGTLMWLLQQGLTPPTLALSPGVSDAALHFLAQNQRSSSLSSLRLVRCGHLSAPTLVALALKSPSLVTLDVSYCNFGDTPHCLICTRGPLPAGRRAGRELSCADLP